MKNIIFSIVLLFAVTASFAQTERGTFMVGGNVGNYRYNYHGKSYSNTMNNFSAGPSAGYFIADNLAVGLNINFYSVKQDWTGITPSYTYTGLDKTHGWGVSPFIRYYKSLSDKFYFFGSLSAGYDWSKGNRTELSPFDQLNYSYKERNPSAMLSPGLVFFPSSKFGLEVTLGSLRYGAYKRDYDGTDYSGNEKEDVRGNAFNFSFGLQNLYLGAYFYL